MLEQTTSEQTPQRRLEVPSTSDTKNDIYSEIASPFLSHETRLLDTKYGIRKDVDSFKIGNSTVIVENMSNLNIKGRQFKGTEDLWKLLTRKKVNCSSIDKNDFKKYKTILEMTNAHWRDTKLVVTFRDFEKLNSETSSRNYLPKPKLHRGKSGQRIETWQANCTMTLPNIPRFRP